MSHLVRPQCSCKIWHCSGSSTWTRRLWRRVQGLQICGEDVRKLFLGVTLYTTFTNTGCRNRYLGTARGWELFFFIIWYLKFALNNCQQNLKNLYGQSLFLQLSFFRFICAFIYWWYIFYTLFILFWKNGLHCWFKINLIGTVWTLHLAVWVAQAWTSFRFLLL